MSTHKYECSSPQGAEAGDRTKPLSATTGSQVLDFQANCIGSLRPIVSMEQTSTPIDFFGHLIILLTDRILLHSPNFGRAKQGQKFVVPTFHIHFLNPECVTIPWVLAPKNFPIENFRVRSDLQKISLFHEFSCPLGKKNRRPAADSILMPQTFHQAGLNRYTPKFPGIAQKFCAPQTKIILA